MSSEEPPNTPPKLVEGQFLKKGERRFSTLDPPSTSQQQALDDAMRRLEIKGNQLSSGGPKLWVSSNAPDIPKNARILAVLGITNDKNEFEVLQSDPTADGWFASDFWLFYRLFADQTPDSVWMHCIDWEKLLQKKGLKYIHGSPFHERKVVLDAESFARITKDAKNPDTATIKQCKPHTLLQEFGKQFTRELNAAAREGRPLVVLLFGHGMEDIVLPYKQREEEIPATEENQRYFEQRAYQIQIGDALEKEPRPRAPDKPGVAEKKPIHDLKGWKISDFKAKVASALRMQKKKTKDVTADEIKPVDMTMIFTSCYSGGWISESSTIDFTAITAAGSGQKSHSWMASGTSNRKAGSMFASTIQSMLSMEDHEHMKLLGVDERHRPSNDQVLSVKGFATTLFKVLMTKVDRKGYMHEMQFHARDGSWEEPGFQSVGLPITGLKQRYDALPDWPRDHTLHPGDAMNRDPSTTAEQRQEWLTERHAAFPQGFYEEGRWYSAGGDGYLGSGNEYEGSGSALQGRPLVDEDEVLMPPQSLTRMTRAEWLDRKIVERKAYWLRHSMVPVPIGQTADREYTDEHNSRKLRSLCTSYTLMKMSGEPYPEDAAQDFLCQLEYRIDHWSLADNYLKQMHVSAPGAEHHTSGTHSPNTPVSCAQFNNYNALEELSGVEFDMGQELLSWLYDAENGTPFSYAQWLFPKPRVDGKQGYDWPLRGQRYLIFAAIKDGMVQDDFKECIVRIAETIRARVNETIASVRTDPEVQTYRRKMFEAFDIDWPTHASSPKRRRTKHHVPSKLEAPCLLSRADSMTSSKKRRIWHGALRNRSRSLNLNQAAPPSEVVADWDRFERRLATDSSGDEESDAE